MYCPFINILILNWNNREILSKCIDSIKKSNYANYQITVIDNGSKDNSVEYISSKLTDIQFIEIDKNLGFGNGYNYAFKKLEKLKGDWYLILNNDTVLMPDSITSLINNIKDYGENNIFSPKILNYKNNSIWFAGSKNNCITGNVYHIGINTFEDRYEYKSGITNYVSGCCMLIKKSNLDKLNGFNSIYNMYYEDVDLCYRARNIGINSVYVSESIIKHHVSYSLRGKFNYSKIYNKIISFIIFLYLNNNKIMFIFYFFINIILSPLLLLHIFIKKIIN